MLVSMITKLFVIAVDLRTAFVALQLCAYNYNRGVGRKLVWGLM
jgi:hypothetical protein